MVANQTAYEKQAKKYKAMQLDMPRYEKCEGIAKRRRMAAGKGEIRPQWTDIAKEAIDKLEEKKDV